MTSTSVPSTYKAYVYERFGTIEEVLTLKDVAAAPLPSTHVRVRVHSVALNPIDYKLPEFFREAFTRSTPSAEKPHPIGFDVAGEVVEIGHDVSGFQLGDKVFAMAGKAGDGLFGTFAEYALVDAKLLALAPSSVALEHAAGVPLVALTGYDALALKAKVQSGERVLVLGGTTSCGIFGIQYAKAIGATVIATTSTKNVAFVQALGADQVIDYTQEKWGDVLAQHSIDVIFDCEIEPESWDGAAQLVLKQNTGRFVTLRPGLTPSAAKFGATYYDVHTEPTGHNLTLISQLIDGGKLKPVVDSVFSFDKMADAFTRLKTGRPVGKVVVKLL